MATPTIEERLTILEQKVAQIIPDEPKEVPQQTAWWKKLVGIYKDDSEFAEAERYGREYREALRPKPIPEDTD